MKRVSIDDGRLASEVTEMLMGNDVAPRKTFIHDHAHDAELDV
jgi:DNA gyrase subunit B